MIRRTLLTIALLCATILAHADTHILFVGGLWTLNGDQLKSMFGPSYDLIYRDTISSVRTSDKPDIVILNFATLFAFVDSHSLDQFFIERRKEVRQLKRSLHPRKFYILFASSPKNETDQGAMMPSLLRQIAREENVETIDLNDPSFPAPDGRIKKIFLSLVEVQRNPGTWRVASATSEQSDEGPVKNAIDNNPDTYWHTRYDPNPTKVPHEIVIDLGKTETLNGFSCLARQDGGVNGRVKDFEIYLSDDPNKWGEPALKGTLQNTMNEQRLLFPKAASGRYLKFVALSEVNGNIWTSIAELGILHTGNSK